MEKLVTTRARSLASLVLACALGASLCLAAAGCANSAAEDGAEKAPAQQTTEASETSETQVEPEPEAAEQAEEVEEAVDEAAGAAEVEATEAADEAEAAGEGATETEDATEAPAASGGVEYPGGDTTGVLAPAKDWTLVDQYGKEHSLADYRGKVVFLNFWTTWCPYCVTEMPDIQELYEEYGSNEGDIVFLGVGNPVTADHPNNSDVSEGEIVTFLAEQGVTYPVLMDKTSDVFNDYKIYYLPTTYLIDPYGNVFQSVTGGMDRASLERVVEAALAGDLNKRM